MTKYVTVWAFTSLKFTLLCSSFNTPHTMKAMEVVPKKEDMVVQRRRFSFFPPPDFDHFPQSASVAQLHWSCDTLRTHEHKQTKTAWCDVHFIFFNRTSCFYSMFGTSTKVTFHCIKRKHIVFKLTLTADKGRFPQRGLLLRRRVSSRRVNAGGCEEEMQLQPAPSFHGIKYSELFIFKGCSGTK